MQQKVLFTAKTPEKPAEDTKKAIRHATMLMAGGMGSAFMGMAPFASPNFFMIGLLAAMVQVHFGYGYMQRIYWTQRRRYVLKMERTEDASGVVTVTVNCDAGVTRKLKLADEAPTGSKPSLKDIIEKGGTFMFIDKKAGEIHDPEMLDTLLQSDRGIREEEVTAEPVMEETKEQSLRIVQQFKDLTREHLDKIPEQDNKSSPQEGLRQLERTAQIVGSGCMVGGLLIWALGDWSAQAAIRAASENYKPQATLSPEGSDPPQMHGTYSRAVQ